MADTVALKASFPHTKSESKSGKQKCDEKDIPDKSHDKRDSSDEIHNFRRIRVISWPNAHGVDNDSLSPTGLPQTRSHKMGAGLAAQAAAIEAKRSTKDPVEEAEKELKSAPIPTVNFWEVRKEAHEAKLKALAAQQPAQVTVKAKPQLANVAEAQKVADDDTRRKQSGKPPTKPEKENGATKRKRGDAVRQRDDGGELPSESIGRSRLTNGEEAIYCYCQYVSYGEMVACDAENCPREWFHLECVGLEKAPGKNSKPYPHLSSYPSRTLTCRL
jgi:hypothetical protein